jgi:transcriptional regulator with XRE-family HTH domain
MRENGVSVKELAEDIGVSQSALYCWLQGAYKPSKKYIDELLKLTGRTYEELFAAK